MSLNLTGSKSVNGRLISGLFSERAEFEIGYGMNRTVYNRLYKYNINQDFAMNTFNDVHCYKYEHHSMYS